MPKIQRTYNLIFKWIFRLFLIFLMFFYILTNFSGSNSNYIWGCIIILLSSLMIDIFFWAVKIELSPITDFFIQVFIIFALLLGNMYNMYDIFPWWDLMLHFVSGILFSVVFLALIKFLIGRDIYAKLPPSFILICISLFSISGAAIWEFWEFAGDQILGLNSQLKSLTDTMTDMIIGSAGGLIMGALCYFNAKSGKFKLLNKFTFKKRNTKGR